MSSKLRNLSFFSRKPAPTPVPPNVTAPEPENGVQTDEYDHSRLPWITWRLVVMGVLVSMGGFIFGYDTGQISGFLGMQVFTERFGQFNSETGKYYFSNVRIGLIVGLLSIGTLIGALIAGPIADKVGRRWSIFGWCLVFHVGNIVQMASPNHHWYEVMMGRWVIGLSVGSLSLMVPMYMAETAPYHTRGAMIRLVVCHRSQQSRANSLKYLPGLSREASEFHFITNNDKLFITLGIFIAACINYGTNKHYHDRAQYLIPMGIGYLWPLILGFGILFFPETPRFDYRKGHVDRATKTMTRVYGVSENHWAIHHEIAEIKAKLEAETMSGGGIRDWIEMFQAPRMAYRIALGMTLQMFQGQWHSP